MPLREKKKGNWRCKAGKTGNLPEIPPSLLKE